MSQKILQDGQLVAVNNQDEQRLRAEPADRTASPSS